MRRKTADRLARIEDALERTARALEGLGVTLDPASPSGLAQALRAKLGALDGKLADLAGTMVTVMASRADHDAAVAADAKAARSAAESAFVATQALAAVATAQPGLGELAGAVATNTEAVRAVHAAVKAAAAAPAAVKPAETAPAAGMGSRVPPKASGSKM